MRAFIVLAGCMLALAGKALGAPAVLTDPDWETKPSGELLAEAFPPLASALVIEGRATIGCHVTPLGLLENCEVVAQDPAGLGFGAAALSLAEHFRMKPQTRNGEPVAGGRVRIPVRFTLPDDGLASERPTRSVAAPTTALRVALEADLLDGIKQSYTAAVGRMPGDGVDPQTLDDAKRALQDAVAKYAPLWAEDMLFSYAEILSPEAQAAMAEFTKTSAGERWFGRPTPLMDWNAILRNNAAATVTDARAAFCVKWLCKLDPAEIDAARVKAAIVDPEWAQTPTWTQLRLDQPKLMTLLGIGGVVRLTCTVNRFGTPEACKITGETPPSLGFGAAALKSTGYFKLSPELMSQGAAGETVSFVVAFDGANFAEGDARATPDATQKPASDPVALGLAREILGLQLSQLDMPANFKAAAAAASIDAVTAQVGADGRAALALAADLQWKRTQDELAASFAAKLTPAELRQVRDFLGSASGKGVGRAGPGLSARFAGIGRYYQSRIVSEARETFCKSRGCTSRLATPPKSPLRAKP
ncbi:MAG TPA: energy transducer TonB [Phenylobacterium sp.]